VLVPLQHRQALALFTAEPESAEELPNQYPQRGVSCGGGAGGKRVERCLAILFRKIRMSVQVVFDFHRGKDLAGIHDRVTMAISGTLVHKFLY
jgi:hypothetical protein